MGPDQFFCPDRLMRSVGLNGKSVMPMISGFACAVSGDHECPEIENRKERLLTILITPLMSCSPGCLFINHN
jgi:ferrous iron transport protein B